MGSKPDQPDRASPGLSLASGLYVVATPIGNLADITLRALDVLRRADIIACEDTRQTARLCARHGIDTPRTAYHEHNARRAAPALLTRLAEGGIVALVSDAGTPLISDPGAHLVEEALAAGLPVHPVPGPSALTAALSVSGLPAERVLFAGFLPARASARRRELATLASVPATLVLYEAPHRLAACLADCAAVLGTDRAAAVLRELTKRFEETRRGTLAALAAAYGEAPQPKGEIVLVIAPPAPASQDPAEIERSLDAALGAAMADQSVKSAVAEVAAALGLPRREVYARALALRDAGKVP